MSTTKKICILGESDVGKTTFIKLIITGIYTEKINKLYLILERKKDTQRN